MSRAAPILSLSSCVLLFGAGLSEAAPQKPVPKSSRPAGSRTFGNWSATCNNIATCVALGSAAEGDIFYLRIERAGGAAAPPQVKIVLALGDALTAAPTGFALTTRTKDKPAQQLGSFAAKPASKDDPTYPAQLKEGEESLRLIDAIRNADSLDYKLADRTGTLDLNGLSAALRWIDSQQGRAGTPTALVAKGMTPIGQVPPPPAAPLVSAAPAGSTSEIKSPKIPKAVLTAAIKNADCEEEVVTAHDDAEAYRLGADQVLYAVPCSRGAYNYMDALFTTDAKGGNVQPLSLPQVPGEDPPGEDPGMGRNIVTNMGFDPASSTLSDFSKGRGIADCGETRSWVWTGKSFVLLEAAQLASCPGALAEDWPNLYTAKRK